MNASVMRMSRGDSSRGSATINSAVPLEQRLLRCDACSRTFVLSYRRPDISQALRATVVRSERVWCPRPECRRPQPVIVPIDGHGVTTLEWLGVSELSKSHRTLGEVLRESPIAESNSRQPDHTKTGSPGVLIGWWRSLAKGVWRSKRRDA